MNTIFGPLNVHNKRTSVYLCNNIGTISGVRIIEVPLIFNYIRVFTDPKYIFVSGTRLFRTQLYLKAKLTMHVFRTSLLC